MSNRAPGPLDIAVNQESQQVALDTPGPRPWLLRHLRTLVRLGLVAVLWFFALLGVIAYLRRYRDPVIVEDPPSPPGGNDETPD